MGKACPRKAHIECPAGLHQLWLRIFPTEKENEKQTKPKVYEEIKLDFSNNINNNYGIKYIE